MVLKRFFELHLIVFIGFSSLFSAYGQIRFRTNDDGFEIRTSPDGFPVQNIDFHPDSLFQKDSWTGDWIWLDSSTFHEFQETQIEWVKNPRYKKQYKALFRKSFELEELPDQAIMSLTADVAFRIYLNEVFVAQGPANIGNDFFDGVPPRHWFFTTHDIRKFLNTGSNTLAVEVFSHFREISETSSGQGRLLCDIDTGPDKNILATDTTWKCMVDTSFIVHGGNFSLNATNAINDWKNRAFDDSAWENASIKNGPKDGYLMSSKIPVPMRFPITPKRLWLPQQEVPMTDFSSAVLGKALYQEEFTLDFDRNLTAYYGFEVIAHKNDTVRISPFEKKYASQNRSLTYVCREGRNVFYAPYLSVFRYLKVEVVSERGLIIKDIRTDFSSYPINYVGDFSCSNEKLSQLWDITRWTTQLCMNDMLYDSPKHQEPIACTGDYFIQSLINYYAFGDPWLVKQTLVKTALLLEKNQYDMFHTSYSLLWVQMLNQYYQYTGDIQLVTELLPHVNKLNQLFETYLDRDYLVSNAPDYMFMDWIKIDQFNAHHPPAVIGMGYMTAFYYKSLLDAAYLNSLVGDTIISDKNQGLAQKIKRSMNDLLWDQGQKRYKDGIPFRSNAANHYFFSKDTNIVTYSPHVNTLAVLYDIAPESEQSALLDYVVHQQFIDLQPYFMFFVLSAVDHAGQFPTLGLELLKKWENGINLETYTLKENWQDQTETGYGGDYSHAWGGSPLFYLSRNMLGIKPGKPGFREIEIHPFLTEKIQWAQGRVPLLQGNQLEISWKRASKLKYVYTLEIPDNSKAFIVIPKDWMERSFKINGLDYSKSTNRIQVESGVFEIEFEAN